MKFWPGGHCQGTIFDDGDHLVVTKSVEQGFSSSLPENNQPTLTASGMKSYIDCIGNLFRPIIGGGLLAT